MNEKTNFLPILLLLACLAIAPGTAGATNTGGHPKEIPPDIIYIGGYGNHATYPPSDNNVVFEEVDETVGGIQ